MQPCQELVQRVNSVVCDAVVAQVKCLELPIQAQASKQVDAATRRNAIAKQVETSQLLVVFQALAAAMKKPTAWM